VAFLTRVDGANDSQTQACSTEDLKPLQLTIERLRHTETAWLTLKSRRARRRKGQWSPPKLIEPMLAHFMASERAFAKARGIILGVGDWQQIALAEDL
jgi:hypothetical protein